MEISLQQQSQEGVFRSSKDMDQPFRDLIHVSVKENTGESAAADNREESSLLGPVPLSDASRQINF